jgi:S-adenosylmethionine:tRNA ribosyltransferase-isomerase
MSTDPPSAPRSEAEDDRLDLYDYPLDPVRIAASPSAERDGARLLVHDRETGRTSHGIFRDLASQLRRGDLLVLNDARVVPARLRARRATGGEVEVLLHPTGGDGGGGDLSDSGSQGEEIVQALLRPSARLLAGEVLTLANGRGDELRLVVVDPPGGELRRVRIVGGLARALELGELPLPPYIERDPKAPDAAAREEQDRERYQTVFARVPGAIAAPTAGLHFTPRLLLQLAAAGVAATRITLHVGPGTFLPVRSDRLSGHAMHEELYEIPEAAAAAIAAARAEGRRVVAVGTTTTRALESAVAADGSVRPGRARTRLMIRPPHRFRAIDGLVTNFHLPRTTLLALVAAFTGRERLLALYSEAAALGYRFYSYGDAMLLT